MVLYVSCDADDAGKLIGRARLADDVEEVRRVSARLDRGLEIVRSWALSVGGSVVEAGGDEITVEVPADHIGALPAVREQYADAVKCTLSVGVGVRLAESAKALYAAKLRGKDQIVFYSPACDELIEKESKRDESEADKMRAEYLDKAAPAMNPGPNAGFAGVTEPAAPSRDQPVATQGDHEEGQVALEALGLDEGQQPSPEMTHAAKDYESQLHDEAWKGEEEDMKGQVDRSGRLDQVKQQVAQALQMLKVKAPILEQVRQVDPDAYKATMALVQSVIALARETGGPSDTSGNPAPTVQSTGQQQIAKAEPIDMDGPNHVFVRFGEWPEDEQSMNHVLGWKEHGVSVYYGTVGSGGLVDIHVPRAVSPNDTDNEEEWNDPDGTFNDLVARHRRGQHKAYVVTGEQTGIGHDGEPVIQGVKPVRELQPHEYHSSSAGLRPTKPVVKAEGVKDRVRQYTKQIQQVLSPDLLKPEYAGGKHCLAGHCYVASEALYHLLGGREAGWTPHVVQHEGGPHWFLKHASGRIADPTASQFATPPPYERGVGKDFMTYPVPSDRGRQVMERMLTERSLSPEDVAGVAGERQLAKMAILDIPRGRKVPSRHGYGTTWSYKHVLSPAQRAAGYTVRVMQTPTGVGGAPSNVYRAKLYYGDQIAGNVSFSHDPDRREIRVKYAEIDAAHRGKGLGVPMYEAAYAHARHALGASHVVGEEHSTSANRVHESLSRKHGMQYEPHDTTGEGDDQEEPFDGRFNGYRYAIKAEERDDSLSKAVKPAAAKKPQLAAPPASEREELVHYSVKPGLKNIDVNRMGTGAPSSEYKQGVPEVGRAYYYRAGSQPEPLVTQGARARYTAHLDPAKHKLYDIGADPEGLRGPARERFLAGEGLNSPDDTLLDEVKRRGYYGFHNSSSAMPHVVALFHAHPVSKGEELGKAAPRMPPQPVGASIAEAPSGAAGSAAAVNKIKVQHSDGSTGTKQVTAGVIRSMDPSEHGTSSRSPNSK